MSAGAMLQWGPEGHDSTAATTELSAAVLPSTADPPALAGIIPPTSARKEAELADDQ